MTKPAEQKQNKGPKELNDLGSKTPENWPDVPDDRSVEAIDNGRDERVDQMRHADDSESISNSTTDTSEGVDGYTDVLVEEELDNKGGREELL